MFAGNGDGTFAAATDYTSGGGRLLVVGDVNGDGISDLITQWNVLLGQGSEGVGDGTFQPVENGDYNLSPISFGPDSVAAGDFNADGKLDLLSTTIDHSGGDETAPRYFTIVNVLLGHGDGTFAVPRSSTVYDSGLSFTTAGDFNGDGFADLAATNLGYSNAPDSVSVFLNNGFWPTAITIDDVSVIEGNSGTTAATFTVSISPAYGQTVSVDYETADGNSWNSATAGADYQSTSGTLTFGPA